MEKEDEKEDHEVDRTVISGVNKKRHKDQPTKNIKSRKKKCDFRYKLNEINDNCKLLRRFGKKFDSRHHLLPY